MCKEPINIEILDISARLKNALRHSGITDLWELENLSKQTILRIRNMGISTYDELEK
jgi:DNA-directed RNA polymerase alpha subunit